MTPVRECEFCGVRVDPDSPSTWRRVIGWERKATSASRRGGSDIVLREPRDEYACNACVTIVKATGRAGQEQLSL